jgi:pimeloyl-ACP methyl ester carboxylesterase
MRSSWRRPILAACLLVAGGPLASCTTSQPPLPTVSGPAVPSQPVASPTLSVEALRPAPHPSVRCGLPAAAGRQVVLRASDGVQLDATITGTGTRGVLLVPELGRQNLCGWWDYAAFLAGRGYLVLLFDHRCTGYSGCPVGGSAAAGLMADIDAATAALRAAGARRVTLVGASQGGAEVLIAGALASTAAATGGPNLAGVSAVAAFSPDQTSVQLAGPPFATAEQAAPALRLPVLVAVAPADANVSVEEVRALFARVPSRGKQLVVDSTQPGVHGWDLLAAGPAGKRPATSDKLLAFLARNTG